MKLHREIWEQISFEKNQKDINISFGAIQII